MLIRKLILFILLFFLYQKHGYTQIQYSGKIEIGYLKYFANIVTIDPVPNWRGYNLESKKGGIDINIINGVKTTKFFAGIGAGYLNFEGVNGVAIFTDFQYLPPRKRVAPIVTMKIGYNHIWNQYENGTRSALFELGGGIDFMITKNSGIYLQTSFLMTQQSLLFPVRLGVRF